MTYNSLNDERESLQTTIRELKKQIAEKTGSNNIEIDFDSIDKFGGNFAEHHLRLLHEWLDSDKFGGSLEPWLKGGIYNE